MRIDSSEGGHEIIKLLDRFPVASGLVPHILKRDESENGVDEEWIDPPLREDLYVPWVLYFCQLQVSKYDLIVLCC